MPVGAVCFGLRASGLKVDCGLEAPNPKGLRVEAAARQACRHKSHKLPCRSLRSGPEVAKIMSVTMTLVGKGVWPGSALYV